MKLAAPLSFFVIAPTPEEPSDKTSLLVRAKWSDIWRDICGRGIQHLIYSVSHEIEDHCIGYILRDFDGVQPEGRINNAKVHRGGPDKLAWVPIVLQPQDTQESGFSKFDSAIQLLAQKAPNL